jgi:hypothetical protein
VVVVGVVVVVVVVVVVILVTYGDLSVGLGLVVFLVTGVECDWNNAWVITT